MKLIAHRRNSLNALQETPVEYGIEVDVRSDNNGLIIQHDPFVYGESFIEWLAHYKHGTLILNVKEEGLEERIIGLLEHHRIDDYFFLDQSIPYLIKWGNAGERRCAVRVSEFESIETALNFSGIVDWVWVDCFSRFPLSGNEARCLQEAGFKLCLVSPELQGRNAELEIPLLAERLLDQKINAEAVCTKRMDIWEQALCL